MEYHFILGLRVDATSYTAASEQVLNWAEEWVGRYVCIANVHMVMEGFDDPEFRRVVNEAALVTPDGMPLVWTLQALGIHAQGRVYGPTLLLHLCKEAAALGVPVGFYGGTPASLEDLRVFLNAQFPGLQVSYAFAPPFRVLTAEEDAQVIADILASRVRILFVGLGCPKQEVWMAKHRSSLPLVQLGVGAAFDFHSGRVRQAPGFLQRMGLEWLFRLWMEPRRLWRRYVRHNPRFVVLVLFQLLGLRRFI